MRQVAAKGRAFLRGRARAGRAIAALRRGAVDRVIYVDAGAAGGLPYGWRLVIRSGLIKAFLVDPSEEWGGAAGSAFGLPNSVRVPFAFGAHDGSSDFFETRMPGCSSCLPPNRAFLDRYPVGRWFDVLKTYQVALRRADSVWAEFGYDTPDIVKLDVQGLELACLEGFGDLLDNVLCIEAETQFQQLYVGQPTLHELQAFLYGRGFMLRHLEPQGPFEGEYIEVNSYWVRRINTPTSRQAAIIAAWEALNDLPSAFSFVTCDPL